MKIARTGPREGAWNVTKKQVAASELSRSIRTLICFRDPISAHVLAGAARDIVHAIAKATGRPRLWDHFKDWIVDEAQDAVYALWKEDYNFFKHADRDPDVVNDFWTPEVTEFFLWETCVDFELVFDERYVDTTFYQIWFETRQPNIVKPERLKVHDQLRAAHAPYFDDSGAMKTRSLAEMLATIDRGDANPPDNLPLLSRVGAMPPEKA
ncbi:MAG: hypothetical protein E7812_01220 [Phenylobacterium sp.]|nr:MAG: hypothetical protein E7812_01220 [Phenylobacterium sp.]